MSDHTPDFHEVRGAYISGLPAMFTEKRVAEFDRFIAKVKADALREAAAGFIDWDALRGDVQVTPEIEASHKSANYLMREADRIEGEA